MPLIQKINTLDDIQMLTKHEKIVRGVSECITERHFSLGDVLPSVNEMANNLGYSRETIVKAYSELKQRGIIHSKQGLGFFVTNNDVKQRLKLALILYGFQTFQQDFYNKFRKSLGKRYQIDVYFHHNNSQMFDSIINNINLKYGKYVVAPIQSVAALDTLDILPKDKLIIIDRYLYINEEVSYISQEFEDSLSIVFSELKERISTFDEIILYYRDDVDYPAGIYNAFIKFCEREGFSAQIYKEYDKEHLKEGCFYFTIGDTDLWLLIKDAKEAGMEIGKDLGILSHNDSLVKEIIEGGITTFSTDFGKMAVMAAESIMEKKEVKEIIPCTLIRRKSL